MGFLKGKSFHGKAISGEHDQLRIFRGVGIRIISRPTGKVEVPYSVTRGKTGHFIIAAVAAGLVNPYAALDQHVKMLGLFTWGKEMPSLAELKYAGSGNDKFKFFGEKGGKEFRLLYG
jgi:hypothetical protein